MQRSDPFSNRVRIYSFLLTVLVIWIHAVQPSMVFDEGTAAGLWFARAQQILGTNLGQIAVPGFFVISGYLFFRGAGTGGRPAGCAFFLRKWKSRFQSLLVPYLVWNLIYYLVYLIAGRAELSPGTALQALFCYRFNPVFWYLQQLIVLTVLAPAVWLAVGGRKRALPVLLLLFLLAVYYTELPFHIVNEDALLYYAAGAAAALHLKDSVEADLSGAGRDLKALLLPAPDAKEEHKKAGRWMTCFLWTCMLYIALQAAGAWGSFYGMLRLSLMGAVGCRLAGTIALYALLMLAGAGAGRTPSFMGYNFFTYATHYLVLRAVQRLTEAVFGQDARAALIVYLLMPAVCIAVSVYAARILRKLAPRAFAVLTGGRT